MAQRKELFYPPFSRLARFICSGISKIDVKKRIYGIFHLLKKIDGLTILGPSLSPIEKIRNSWRYHILVKYDIKNPKNLEMITRILFSSRRKMINKNFIKLFGNNKSLASDLNINLNQRPEELSNEMFYKITMKYEELYN